MHERNDTIASDFLRYSTVWFCAFVFIGTVFSWINGFSWAAVLFNPLAYSIGLSLIIVVLKYDFEELKDFCGLSRSPSLKPTIQFSRELQEISLLMSYLNYRQALKKVDILLEKEPQFPAAYNLRGEILLNGFQKNKEARECFRNAQKYAAPGDEDFLLAQSLQAATYDQ